MRNLITYEKYLILERNKAVEFFQENPQLLSSFSKGIEKHAKSEWNPKKNGIIDKTIEDQREDKAKKVLSQRLSKIDGVEEPLDPTDKNGLTIIEVLSGKSRNGWSGWYDWKYFMSAILDSRSMDDLIKKASVRERIWSFPGENYSTRKDLSQYGKFYKILKDNFEEIKKSMKWIDTALKGIKGSVEKGFENDLAKLGLSTKDVEVAMSHIDNWTSMSRKKLDPQVWPLLQKISVDSRKLPEYIYRGIFYDGAKIKDEKKFLDKWTPGSKPGASQGKATSWSIDRGTAASFMTDQDFIKDNQKGYYVLLKWKVDPSKVISDLRNLPVDHRFWNQQEIIVSPEAKDYEIDTIIPGSGGYKAHHEFIETIKGGQGAWGRSKTEFALAFMNQPYETLNPNQRIEFKKITKMTIGEFESEYPGTNFSGEWKDVPLPIWNYLKNYMSFTNLVSVKGNVVEFEFRVGLNDLYYSADPLITATFDKVKAKTEFNQFSGTTELVSDIGIIELKSSDYYDMELDIKMPTKFEIGKNQKSGEPRSMDIISDDALKSILDEIGSDKMIEAIKKKQTQKTLPKNINIQIK